MTKGWQSQHTVQALLTSYVALFCVYVCRNVGKSPKCWCCKAITHTHHPHFVQKPEFRVLQVAPALLQHPSVSVRSAAVEFISAAASFLSPPDLYAHLLPLITPAVTSEPASLTSQQAIVEQLPKQLQQRSLERARVGSSNTPSLGVGSRRPLGSYAPSDASVSSASSLKRAGKSPKSGRTAQSNEA